MIRTLDEVGVDSQFPGGEPEAPTAPATTEAPTTNSDGGVMAPAPGIVGEMVDSKKEAAPSEPTLTPAQRINLATYGNINGPQPGPAAPPAVPPPPPPAQFNIGGAGGGEAASSFARPGTAAARPFRSMDFVRSRVQGGSPMDLGRRVGFGTGSAVVGGQGGGAGAAGLTAGDFNTQGGGGGGQLSEEEVARILAQIAAGTGGQ